MQEIIDQCGHKLILDYYPVRIISIVPSQTELIYDLGLDKEIIGITKFCTRPDHWHKNKLQVGGTKKLNLELIRSLKPDMIIGNKEENSQFQIRELQKEFPVWLSDIYTLDDAYEMIESLGKMTGKEAKSRLIIDKIRLGFEELSPMEPKTAAYFIWQKPYMVAASYTFIQSILSKWGLENVFSKSLRYPEINLEEIHQKDPEIIMLSSEPFPFNERNVGEFSQKFPKSRVILVDGEMFSWFGSRLIEVPGYLNSLKENLVNSFRESIQ